MDLNEITKDVSHCKHGALFSNYSWIFQIILATAAFSCLIGNKVKYFFKSKLKFDFFLFLNN